MKINIVTKNYVAGERLKGIIDKKFEKLSKYFAKDALATVTISEIKGKDKMEATISIKGMFFRAEAIADDAYTAVDLVVDKLDTQMSRFKTKLQRRFKDNKDYTFDDLPDAAGPEPGEELIIRKKLIALAPMSADEAIMQLELLGHDFFAFINSETSTVAIVYRRKNGDYGMLETLERFDI